jgi:D-alanine-D-alanine ligase
MLPEANGLRVVVLAGGDSAEREISLASGRAVVDALTTAGHQPHWIDPASRDLANLAWSDFDACFIALHGGAGEDGRIQAQLDSLGICYTGSGPAASRLAMSKSAAKELFVSTGLSTAPYRLFDCEGERPLGSHSLDDLGFPLVVKPDRQGSSLGVGFAADHAELGRRIAEARQFDTHVLVERWIDGREFTVAVAGCQALPIVEIVTPRGLFDYEAKYESALTEYRFDHGLSETTADRITDLALSAVQAIGCTGLVRVDLMLDTQGRAWLLEVNTVPGLTEHSLAPKAAAQAGITMPELCTWMLHEALGAEVTS